MVWFLGRFSFRGLHLFYKVISLFPFDTTLNYGVRRLCSHCCLDATSAFVWYHSFQDSTALNRVLVGMALNVVMPKLNPSSHQALRKN